MVSCRISCLLFIGFITSLIRGDADLVPKKFKTSKNVVLSFKSSLLVSEPPSDEEIIDEIKEIEPNIGYYLHVQLIPEWAQFIVLQTHVYLHNVTLSYNIDKVPNRYVTGQNIGLVGNASSASTAQFFLENDNDYNVTVLIAVVAYNKNAPVPGGCNLEFEVETAPWLRVNATGAMVVVSSQPAKGPSRSESIGRECGLTSFQYQAYHLYLPEKDFFIDTYFDFLRKMMTAKRIALNGRKVSDSTGESPMRHLYSAYHGTGSVYGLVVSASTTQYAAYVPALTYNCNPAQYTDSCQLLSSTFSRSLCALVLFVGLFVCFFGHSFFQTELFLFSTLVGGILFYLLIAPLGMTDSTNVALATVGGVTVGNVWLVLWWACGSPMLSLVMATTALGILLTSIAFYTFLADLPSMESDMNFWLAVLCCMLCVALLFGPLTNRVNILACCTVGSYAAIVPIDHYVGANLKYIFINMIRRATVPGFNEAVIDPPFQTKDGLLTGLWLVLAVAGLVMQVQRFGDRPVFPRSPQTLTHRASATLLAEERPLLYAQPVGDSPSPSFFS